MKALVLHEPGTPLVLEDRPKPEPGPGEVLLRVRACGLGLTLVWNKNQRNSRSANPGRLPRVIGHEVAGDIEAVGEGVTGFAVGDAVAVYYYLICGDCDWCRQGREDLCERLAGQVGRQIDGGLAEYMVLPERNVVAMPEGLDYVDVAIATDGVATPVHVLRHRAKLLAGETALVIGAGGGVGVHQVAVARAFGASVIAVDLGAEKLKAAESAGAEWTIDASSTTPVIDAVREITGGRGVDVVVDMVGIDETFEASLASVGKGGRVVFVGTYKPDAVLALSPWSLGAGEIVLTGSRYCTRHDLAVALELVRSGQVRPIVTRTCDLEGANEVLEAIERNEVVARAAVVMPD